MASIQEKNADALNCYKDQDDLAMFELNSALLIREGNRLIDPDSRRSANTSNSYDGYGDDDSDDSDVIFMGTSATVASECSKNCRTSKGTIAARAIDTTTGHTKRDSPFPFGKEKIDHLLRRKKRVRSYYNGVFEGCNSLEPIEIDDESPENAGDFEGTIGITVNTRCVFPAPNNGTIFPEIQSATPLPNPKVSSGNTKKKDNQYVVKKLRKGKKKHQKKSKAVDDVYMCQLGKNPNVNSISAPIAFHPSTASISDCSDMIHSPSLKCTANPAIPFDASNKDVVFGEGEKQCSHNIEFINLCQEPCGIIESTDEYDSNANARRHHLRIDQEKQKKIHEENHSKQPNHLAGMTKENKISDYINNLDLLQANSMSVLISKDVQLFGESELKFDKNCWLPRCDINSLGEEKKQIQIKVESTLGGIPPMKKSVATEVSESTKICNTNEGAYSKVESDESVVKQLPKSAFIEKADLSFSYERCQEMRKTYCDFDTEGRSIQIIDDDDMKYIEIESENDREFKCEANCETEREESNSKIKIKPRFKPYKNKKLRKSEKEANVVPDKKNAPFTKINDFSTYKGNSVFRRSNFQCSSRSNNSENLSKCALPACCSCNAAPQKDGGKTDTLPNSFKSKSDSQSPENRFIFHPSNGKPDDHHSKNFLGMNIEDALKEQERLLRKAAARVRNQPMFRVQTESRIPKTAVGSIRFSTIMRNVHLEYSNHWKLRDFYSRLGLPVHANESMIKSQYRRLARVYHPDRNIGGSDTKHKFQAVTEAYINLMNG